ncbi:Lipoprotein-releasing system transmembrane protein LolE [bioreactor metagenome]|uniref:Lipoprotein-releasing system transmembrane protein LolE n=1 Tax=bioreactor metagenome TaxID=1076179 RepID=A0A644Y181_9ZZZZ
MLIAFAIVRGFQHEVREKIIGFGAHIQIRPFDTNESLEQTPVATGREDIAALKSLDGIKSVYPFVEKGGLIKTDSNIHGVVMRGVDADFDFTFLQKNLVDGRLPDYSDTLSNDVLVSQKVASMLGLKVGSPLRVYFIISGEMQPRGRRFNVCGIFNTGMMEFDKIYSICDMRHLQKLNNWGDTLVSGYEIRINNFDDLPQMMTEVNNTINYDLEATDIVTRQAVFFDWLSLLDSNVLIILILMTVVAIINIISIILILILERIPFIGLFKALGAGNRFVRDVFVNISVRLLLRGIIIGNVFGLGLIVLQKFTFLFPLNEEMYYVGHIPVLLQADYIIGVNAGVFAVSLLAVLLPALIIRRINPSAALQHK